MKWLIKDRWPRSWRLETEDNRLKARREIVRRNLLIPGCFPPERGFIVLNAARNQRRKRLDITMAAFANFARDKSSDVRLWLHTASKSPIGWDIQALARTYGIVDRLMLTQGGWSHPSVTVDDLNVIYNACDVGLNTAMGETWGLASFEHAATGAPQILTALPALQEIWPRGVMWAATAHRHRQGFNLDGCPPDVDTVSQALETLYTDCALRHRMGIDARLNSLEHANQIGTIRKCWAALLQQTSWPPAGG